MRKRREATSAEPLAGTEGGVSPFFSPDGKWIGFMTIDAKLKKLPASGGSPITITESVPTDYKTAAWMDDGTIVYGAGTLMRTASTSGAKPRPLRFSAKDYSAFIAITTIAPLPGSRGVLFTACRGNCALSTDAYIYDFAADSARLLMPHVGGRLVLAYRARVVHHARRRIVRRRVRCENAHASVRPRARHRRRHAARIQHRTEWLDSVCARRRRRRRALEIDVGRPPRARRTVRLGLGRPLRLPGPIPGWAITRRERPRAHDRPLDPAARRVAPEGQRHRGDELASAHGSAMAVRSLTSRSETSRRTRTTATVYRVGLDAGATPTQILRQNFGIYEAQVSPDSQWLVFRVDEGGGNSNIYARRMSGDTARRTLAVTPAVEMNFGLSPNGQWLAYMSEESGVREIYVASFPDMKTKRIVSRGGGTEPRWARSGRELFFESKGQLAVVAVGAGPELQVSEPRALFSLSGYRRARNHPQYDVAPGDQRFLMIKEPPAPAVLPVVFVDHWFSELLAKVKP